MKGSMGSVIKKIFSGKTDEEVHSEFVKFGKGTFEDKYLLEGKKQKDKWAIKSSAEFGNFLVRKCLEKASGNVAVKGVIVATFDVSSDADFEVEKVKKFMGIQQAVINTTTDPDKVLTLMDKHPKAFFALSFSTNGCELKIKPKAPRSKPSSKGEKKPKADFCKLKTSDEGIVKDLFFDFPDFKTIMVRHVITVEKIALPEGEKDPVKVREKAVREGKIKRIVDYNSGEEEFIEEKKFVA